MDIFFIIYLSENIDKNMYDKFIIFIGREVRFGWYLYVFVKDLDLYLIQRLYLNLFQRYFYFNILLVKKKLFMIRGEKKISWFIKIFNVIEMFYFINFFN